MNPGQLLGFAWVVACWFFLLAVFVLPVVNAYWRASERRDAKQTKAVMDSLLHDHSHQYEQDAM